MTEHDVHALRREVTEALLTAFDRRHEVLDAIVDATTRQNAVAAVAALLGTSTVGGEAVMGMRLDQLTVDARRRNATELEDLNSRLSFTLAERPASSGDGLILRTFSGLDDADIFAVRLADMGTAGDGSGAAAEGVEQEITKALSRVDAEQAAWFVAIDGSTKVGIVFGELVGGEVDLRIWVHPEHRKKGYGTASLRKSRSELAAAFPGAPLLVRAPGAPA